MKIKLDSNEFDCNDFEETNEGKDFSFKVDVPTKEEKESLIKLLTKKHLTFTKENGETIKATVNNNSHSYSLRDGQTEPDVYHFSISLEKFDKEAEVDKLVEEIDNKQKLTYLALNISVAIRDLLIDKGTLTKEEFSSKMDILEKELTERLRKSAEEVLEKKFESGQ